MRAGNYIQSLYVPSSVATGVFKYGKQENNKWVDRSIKEHLRHFHTGRIKEVLLLQMGYYMPEPGNEVA